MVIIALLNLPLELPPDAPARQSRMTSFTDKLPEWLSRCKWLTCAFNHVDRYED